MFGFAIYIVAVVTIALGQNQLEVPNLSVIKTSSDYYHCVLQNDSLKSALLWYSETTDTAPSDTILCNFYTESGCWLSRKKESWSWPEYTDFPPVLDYRWESFPVVELKTYSSKICQPDNQSFQITFSLKASNETHIFLCDGDAYAYNCYWISLDAYNGKTSYIRKCTEGQIPQADDYPRYKNCFVFQTSVNYSDPIIKLNQWNHFTVSKQENVITLRKYGRPEPLLEFVDTSSVFEIKHILGRSNKRNYNAYVKVHKVRTLLITNKAESAEIVFKYNAISAGTYLSLYVKTCEQCSFKMNDPNGLSTIRTEKLDDWYEIQVMSESSDRKTIIRLETSLESYDDVKRPYWYISDTVRKSDTDTAIKKIYRNFPNSNDDCCYALKYPDHKICATPFNGTSPEGTGCPTNTIGTKCMPCNSVDDREFCVKSKVCELSSNGLQCSCSAGYNGSNCNDQCPHGTFGFDCKQECGRCQGTCNYVDGNCRCDLNFKGDMCRTAILPLLKNAPSIITVGRTNIEIEANLDYEGQYQPTLVEIQHKEVQSDFWTSFTKLAYENKILPITISGLKSNTAYNLRIILYNIDGNKYDGKFVPKIEFRTTCGDISEDFLTHAALNNSITVDVDKNKPHFEELCSLFNYNILLKNKSGSIVYNRKLSSRSPFINLEPDTEYTIEIFKNTSVLVLRFAAKTDEGAPTKVVDPKMTVSTETSVTLEWGRPSNPNGMIRGYRVETKYIRGRACSTSTVSYDEGEAVTNTVKEQSITITNLLPYSVYRATIWAYTKYDGDKTEMDFETAAVDKPDEIEFGEIGVTLQKDVIKISVKWDCLNLRGLLSFRLHLICQNEWCFNNGTIVGPVHINASYLSFPLNMGVMGNTNYTLSQIISRNNQKLYRNTTILTYPSEPHAVRKLTVYSKSKTWVSLRWLPPYPPTGVIEYYSIYEYSGYEAKIESTSACKLWLGEICANLTAKGSGAYYNVYAKNLDVPTQGPIISTDYIYHKEEAPQVPLNMTLEWDNEYKLTIRWHHPDITNGNLIQFTINIEDTYAAPYKIMDEMPEYIQEVHIHNQTAKKLNVEVQATNSAGSSPKLTSVTYSPPKKPQFIGKPNIDEYYVGNTSFIITIPSVSNVEGDKSYMFIVITDTKNPVERSFLHAKERQLFEDIKVKREYSWVVNEVDLTDPVKKDSFTFEVGDDEEFVSKTDADWKFVNRKLQTGNSYNISIVLGNTFQDHFRYNVYQLNCTMMEPEIGSANYLFALLLIPIVLCILCVVYIRRNRDKMNTSIYASLQQLGLSRNTNDVPMSPLIPARNASPSQTPPQSSEPTVIVRPRSKVIKPVEKAPQVDKKYSEPVKIITLDKYIKGAIESGEFEKQHGVFERGQTKPWTYGTKPENKSKNRYTNLAAYDHSRVKLKIINNDPYSDYINANYIDGYKQQKAYIATQGPKVSTVNDFWRMIWEEKSEYIIMIANIIEAGKKKVEKYWPEINDTKEYGDIKVQYVSVDVMANYEVRYFNVTCGNEKRSVQQFHFLTWPDHGVPLYAQSLAPFLKKVLTIPQGKSPVVVHCSAGVGRTGSLILCDICLRMAAREGKIDAFHYLYKIRDQRVNMVDNVEQYKLVHLVLLQCLVAPETGVLCDETMEENIETILSTNIKKEMKYLEDSSWQDEAMRNTGFTSDQPIVHAKNRFKNILPDTSVRILLSPYPSSDQSSAYINAVTVDAFLTPSKFIVTQDPLSNTVGDFWRLIEDKQITMIICLNELDFKDKTTCKFYPASSEQTMKPVPYLEVKYTGKEVNAHFIVYSVTMTHNDDQQDDLHIKIMHLNNWSYDMLHPESPLALLTAYEEMNRLGRTSDNILITCHDGARASGLFVSMCFVIDKIKMEQICDVCLAVRTVRHSRKEFVSGAEQFSFLYRSGLEYVRQFAMYANFSSNKSSK